VLRGAPTEIDAINGAIVRAGAQMGVPTPINRTLWQLLKALTSKGAGVRKP
jgi:2-dehydropantoate 2-reductase